MNMKNNVYSQEVDSVGPELVTAGVDLEAAASKEEVDLGAAVIKGVEDWGAAVTKGVVDSGEVPQTLQVKQTHIFSKLSTKHIFSTHSFF